MRHTPILTIRREQAPGLKTTSHILPLTDRPETRLPIQPQTRGGEEVTVIRSRSRQGSVPNLAQTTQTDPPYLDMPIITRRRRPLPSRLWEKEEATCRLRYHSRVLLCQGQTQGHKICSRGRLSVQMDSLSKASAKAQPLRIRSPNFTSNTGLHRVLMDLHKPLSRVV